MYIPPGITSSAQISPVLRRLGDARRGDAPSRILPVSQHVPRAVDHLMRRAAAVASGLQARETSQSLNTTIGIVVGVILGLFIIGLLAFCWWYRFSIRFTYRKKRRHRGSKSGSSKSSRSSDGGAPPPPPPPPEE